MKAMKTMKKYGGRKAMKTKKAMKDTTAEQQALLAALHTKVRSHRGRSTQTPLHVAQTECAALG